MGVIHLHGEPRLGLLNVNAQLLVQLAGQGLHQTLARFELAARELPIPGIHLAGRACGEQKLTVGLKQDAHRHFQGLRWPMGVAGNVGVGNPGVGLGGVRHQHSR